MKYCVNCDKWSDSDWCKLCYPSGFTPYYVLHRIDRRSKKRMTYNEGV